MKIVRSHTAHVYNDAWGKELELFRSAICRINHSLITSQSEERESDQDTDSMEEIAVLRYNFISHRTWLFSDRDNEEIRRSRMNCVYYWKQNIFHQIESLIVD